MQVREFAGGRASLVSVRARARCAAWWATAVAELRNSWPDVAVRLVAIYRRFPDEPDRFVPALATPASSRATRCLCWPPASTSAHVLGALHRSGQQRCPCAAS
jgi:trk system potassium uptake protein TrkA